MQVDATDESTSKGALPRSPGPVTVDVLVKEVYKSAPQKVKKDILNLLVGDAYEASSLPVRKSLLEHLIRSGGVLGLVSVAGGRVCGNSTSRRLAQYFGEFGRLADD